MVDKLRVMEKFLSFWLPEQVKSSGKMGVVVESEWPTEDDLHQGEQTLRILYARSFQKFGFDFFLKKRIEKRLWSVIGSHMKALQQEAVSQRFSNSAWESFLRTFDDYYNYIQNTFSQIFKQENLMS